MASTSDSYSNIDVGEFVNANNQEGFVDLCYLSLGTKILVIRMTDLKPEDFWLDEGERLAIDFDEAFSFLRMVSIDLFPTCTEAGCTLQCATAVAAIVSGRCCRCEARNSPVFFLPKHCTLCDEDMIASLTQILLGA